jgi:hypothetical protein
MPFVEMMITMMKIMNGMMGGNKTSNYLSAMNSLPYSPMLAPMSVLNQGKSLGDFNQLNNMLPTHTNSIGNNINTENINGIWEALSGDVIAIYKNNKFIWSDGNSRNLAGQLIIKNNMLYAYIPAKNITLQFQFRQEAEKFIVRDKQARTYIFTRLH